MEALQAQLAELQAQNAALQAQLQQRQPPPEVSRISVKPPPFWRDRPALWFAQLEAQFTLAGITTEATKYSYVIANLDERYAKEVEDLLSMPPTDTPYTKLKTELIHDIYPGAWNHAKRVRA